MSTTRLGSENDDGDKLGIVLKIQDGFLGWLQQMFSLSTMRKLVVNQAAVYGKLCDM